MGIYRGKPFLYARGGAAVTASTTKNIMGSGTTSVASEAGVGVFYYMLLETAAVNDAHLIAPQIVLDGEIIMPGWKFDTLTDKGFDAHTAPLSLLKQTDDGLNILQLFYPYGLPFSETFNLQCHNSAVGDIWVVGSYTITKF